MHHTPPPLAWRRNRLLDVAALTALRRIVILVADAPAKDALAAVRHGVVGVVDAHRVPDTLRGCSTTRGAVGYAAGILCLQPPEYHGEVLVVDDPGPCPHLRHGAGTAQGVSQGQGRHSAWTSSGPGRVEEDPRAWSPGPVARQAPGARAGWSVTRGEVGQESELPAGGPRNFPSRPSARRPKNQCHKKMKSTRPRAQRDDVHLRRESAAARPLIPAWEGLKNYAAVRGILGGCFCQPEPFQ
jgi:hypothetical protein